MAKCFLDGLCGQVNPDNLKEAMEDPVLAPFAEVKVKDASGSLVAIAHTPEFLDLVGIQRTFGVGNSSFPAVIKSMQVGVSNGAGCDIEIIDQEGGDFKNIFQKISRGGSSTDYLIEVRWGWISNQCGQAPMPQSCTPGGGDPTKDPEAGIGSPPLTFAILNIAVNYSQGTIRYTLNCIDMMQSLYDSASNAVMGGGEFITLGDAIRELLNDRRIVVEFKKFTDATTEGEFEWVDNGWPMDPQDGPYGIWETSNRPVLAIIEEWIRPLLADDEEEGKGIKIIYDPSFNPPKVICMCAIGPVCKYRFSGDFQIGTYAVNAGKCSPVISFQPVIRYSGAAGYATGGTAGGAHSPTTRSGGHPPCLANEDNLPNVYGEEELLWLGYNLAISPSRNEVLGRMLRAAYESYTGAVMNALANSYIAPIQADLRIQGNPNLSRPILLIGRFVALIVINPYQIDSGCVWSNNINGEACNEILSKSNWQIEGVFHDIRDGSYTTTLRLRLAGPGQEMPLLGVPGGG